MYEPRPPLTLGSPDPPVSSDSSASSGTKKLGRPRALDDAKKREICALIAAGAGITRASKYVGCTVHTVMNESRRDPDFAEKLRTAEAKAELEPINLLRNKARSNWRAAAFLLNKVSDERKQALATGDFDQKCLREFRIDFKRRLEQEVKDTKLRSWIADTFMACFCNFTRELDRMLPVLDIDFETQKLWEQKLKEKGFLTREE